MCEPVTIATVVVAAVGTTIAAVSEANKGAAADAAAKRDADTLDTAGADAARTSAQQAGLVAMDAGRVEGAQKSYYASNNLSESSDSAAAVMADSRLMADIDRQTIVNNAAREAYGYEKQAKNLRQYGAAAKGAAELDAVGTGFQGAASILGTVGRSAERRGMPTYTPTAPGKK
jgi:hypothetical protein